MSNKSTAGEFGGAAFDDDLFDNTNDAANAKVNSGAQFAEPPPRTFPGRLGMIRTALQSNAVVSNEVLNVFQPLLENFNSNNLSSDYGFKLASTLFTGQQSIPSVIIYTVMGSQVFYSVLLLEYFMRPNPTPKQVIPVHQREPIAINWKTFEYFDSGYNESVCRWLSGVTGVRYDKDDKSTSNNFILSSRIVIGLNPVKAEDFSPHIIAVYGSVYRAMQRVQKNVTPAWVAQEIDTNRDALTASFQFRDETVLSAEGVPLHTTFQAALRAVEKVAYGQSSGPNNTGNDCILAAIVGSIDFAYTPPPRVPVYQGRQEPYKPFRPIVVVKEIIPSRSSSAYHPDTMMVLLGLAMARRLIKCWPLAFPAGSEALKQLGHFPMFQHFMPELAPASAPIEIIQHRDPNQPGCDIDSFVRDYFSQAIVAVDVVEGGVWEWLLKGIFDLPSHNSFGKKPGSNQAYKTILDTLEKFSGGKINNFSKPFNLAHTKPLFNGEAGTNNYGETYRGYFQDGLNKAPLDSIDVPYMVAKLAGNNANLADLNGFIYGRMPLTGSEALLYPHDIKELIKHTKPTAVIQNTIRRHYITAGMLDLIEEVLSSVNLPIDAEGLSMMGGGTDYQNFALDANAFDINGIDGAFAGSGRNNGSQTAYRRTGGGFDFA